MSAPLCELLPWDSEFFGRRIARLNAHILARETAAEAVAWCADNRVECLYFLATPDDPATIRAAETNGFRLVDLRVTLGRGYSSFTAATAPPSVRGAQPADIDSLVGIARVSHTHSRFYADPGFPDGKCDDLYEIWIRRSYDGWAKQVLVAESDGRVAGYCSCHFDDAGKTGSIGLIAVGADFRGQGLGRDLVRAASAWFHTQGAENATVVTQGSNVAAQRLYQQAGFVTKSVELWYHKWFAGE